MRIFETIASLFGESWPCPSCGTPGAKKSDDRIHCPKPGCMYYDSSMGTVHSVPPAQKEVAATSDSWPSSPRMEASDLSSRLLIRYVNYQKVDKIFQVDANSVKRRNNHILAREQRSGRQITLSRSRIQNMAKVDLALPEKDRSGAPRPTASEKQVLAYHKKYKSTSPLYEKIRAKYPNW